jgi:hypothetical protein
MCNEADRGASAIARTRQPHALIWTSSQVPTRLRYSDKTRGEERTSSPNKRDRAGALVRDSIIDDVDSHVVAKLGMWMRRLANTQATNRSASDYNA